MTSILQAAHNFQVDNLTINVISSFSLEIGPLKELETLIAPEALHDSAERCDAPKCHPETRTAVQDDLYSWIEHEDTENPHKLKWVTGPAGTGKTDDWSPNENGLCYNHRSSAGTTPTGFEGCDCGIDSDNIVFKKNLHVQMETLVLGPLRAVASGCNARFRGVIIVDGLDECEVEQIHIAPSTGQINPTPARTNDQDQLEILEVLRQASSDSAFPFRILIASRPERVFREFFDPEQNPTPSFAPKLDLNEDYNANADITLFLESHFNRIRRRYNLPLSWPPPEAIRTLVRNASGQFIYATTVIRFLESSHRQPPKALLEAILEMEMKFPLGQLDVLYSHILGSSPDPLLSVRWIRSIMELDRLSTSYASNVQLLLQTDPDSSEAEHFLGTLHSLIRIPRPSDQATTRYDFYHKSLYDFLEDPGLCGSLYVDGRDISVSIWNGFIRACARGCDSTRSPDPERFLEFLRYLPSLMDVSMGSAHSQVVPTAASADWWVSSVITQKMGGSLWYMFQAVHRSVRAASSA